MTTEPKPTSSHESDLPIALKLQVILSYGFVLAPRVEYINPKHGGHYMIVEGCDIPTEVDAEDTWAVVGDQVEELINEAFNACAFYSHFEAVVADVRAGGVGVLHTDGTAAGPPR